MRGDANSIVTMKAIILVIVCLLAGYLIFSDKSLIVASVKKRLFDLDLPTVISKEPALEDVSPAATPDYSEKDREHLDSILRENQK